MAKKSNDPNAGPPAQSTGSPSTGAQNQVQYDPSESQQLQQHGVDPAALPTLDEILDLIQFLLDFFRRVRPAGGITTADHAELQQHGVDPAALGSGLGGIIALIQFLLGLLRKQTP